MELNEGPDQIDRQLKTMLVKNTDFFGDGKRYKEFLNDEINSNHDDILDVELECLGYGHFYPDKVYERLLKYVKAIMDNCPNLKSFKIIFNGFTLTDRQLFKIMLKGLKQKKALKVLAIHTNNLKNCKFDDFTEFISLIDQLGAEKNLEDFSIQCSNWKFEEPFPTKTAMHEFFQKLITENQGGISKLEYIKRFRMQISGWLMDKKDVMKFLLGVADSSVSEDKLKTEVEHFHNSMKDLVEGLLECMPIVNLFELDIRNWHQAMSMKELQKKLSNVKRDKRNEPSYISKRQQLYYDEDDKKNELVTSFVM